GQATVVGGTITGNSAGKAGGIYTEGTVSLTGTAITANQASNQGGGVFIQSGTVTMGGNAIVSGNRATGLNGGLSQGGGVYNAGGLLTTTATTFAYDTADAGGALYIYNFGTMHLNAVTVVHHGRATNIGGGLLNFGVAHATGVTFDQNFAVNRGGGLFSATQALTTVTNGTVTGSRAQFGGGVYNEIGSGTDLAGTTVA